MGTRERLDASARGAFRPDSVLSAKGWLEGLDAWPSGGASDRRAPGVVLTHPEGRSLRIPAELLHLATCPSGLGSGAAVRSCSSVLVRAQRSETPQAAMDRSQVGVLTAHSGGSGPFKDPNTQRGPDPGLTTAIRALGPDGKPHPWAKVSLLFENILVPGSHPRKVPESAVLLHPNPCCSRSTRREGGNSRDQAGWFVCPGRSNGLAPGSVTLHAGRTRVPGQRATGGPTC